MNHSITSQYAVAAKSANKSLGMINNTFVFKDNNTVLKLFKSLFTTEVRILCSKSVHISVNCTI